MKKQILIIVFVTCGLFSKAQQKTEIFYKDFELKKRVGAPKANFKKVETINTDGTSTIQAFNLSKNCIIKEENYKNNHPIGVWTKYTENCSLESIRDFSKLVYSNEKIDAVFNNSIKDNDPDNYVRAQYGDSKSGYMQYFHSNLKYPKEAKEANASGRVVIQFIIQTDGSVKVVQIIKSANAFLDYEAWELIEKMPKWNPATKDGHPIESYVTMPISFTLR